MQEAWSPWTAWPWRWMHYRPSKSRYMLTSRSSVTSEKTWIFSHTALRTSNLAKWNCAFLALFAKLRKATTSFVMSVRLSVHKEQLGSQGRVFQEIWYLSIFRKCVEIIQVSLKYDKNNWHFPWRPMYIYFNSSKNETYFIKCCRGNQIIHFVFSNVFPIIVPFMRYGKMWYSQIYHRWKY